MMGGMSMFLERRRGVLLHFTSLPGPYGAGDLGPVARSVAEGMAAQGWTIWQMLPLNYPNPAMGFSPYASYGALPLNPTVISLDDLAEEGWIPGEELRNLQVRLPDPWRADLQGAFRARRAGVALAFQALKRGHMRDRYLEFRQREWEWLEGWGVFMALKDSLGGSHWVHWPERFRSLERALAHWDEGLEEGAELYRFEQFLARRQLDRFRAHCEALGVRLLGDMPIYVAHDGMDPWACPYLFELDGEGKPVEVAGVPPDYFSETGQRWGNPLYRWEAMGEDRYLWWRVRLRKALEWFHAVRLDHFRGFAGYWAIPAEEMTAVRGRWRPGPGEALFDALVEDLGGDPSGEGPSLPIVAEDLGVITQDVTRLRLRYRLPGMRVLQFAFSGGDDNPHLPFNHEGLGLAYTGTHDNDTTLGWWLSASAEERRGLFRYVGRPLTAEEAVREMVRLALNSPSRWRIVPLQDLMLLGSRHRMNTPSSREGNWVFRAMRVELDGLLGG